MLGKSLGQHILTFVTGFLSAATMAEADPYRVLGVAASASQPEIRARFLALSLEVGLSDSCNG